MASLPYPLNRLVHSCCQCGCHHSIGLCTHIVNLVATTQSACILMYVWVWQGCHTLLQIPILLFSLKTCSYVLLSFPKDHVLMFSCLSQKPVLMFFCLSPKQHVLMFSCLPPKTCSHVLLSFPKKPVLMFFCLSKQPCSLVFPPNNHVLPPPRSLCRQKKTAGSNAPSR